MMTMGDSVPQAVPTVGVLARFDFEPGREAEVADFFREGKLIVETQPPTTGWYAFRIDATTFGAFAVFADEDDRRGRRRAGGPQSLGGDEQGVAAPPPFR